MRNAFFAHDNYWYRETHVSEDGRTLTISGNGNFKETKAVRVEGSVFTFTSINAGQLFTVRDTDGNVVFRDRGVVSETILFDTLGDGEPGGTFIDILDSDPPRPVPEPQRRSLHGLGLTQADVPPAGPGAALPGRYTGVRRRAAVEGNDWRTLRLHPRGSGTAARPSTATRPTPAIASSPRTTRRSRPISRPRSRHQPPIAPPTTNRRRRDLGTRTRRRPRLRQPVRPAHRSPRPRARRLLRAAPARHPVRGTGTPRHAGDHPQRRPQLRLRRRRPQARSRGLGRAHPGPGHLLRGAAHGSRARW